MIALSNSKKAQQRVVDEGKETCQRKWLNINVGKSVVRARHQAGVRKSHAELEQQKCEVWLGEQKTGEIIKFCTLRNREGQ